MGFITDSIKNICNYVAFYAANFILGPATPEVHKNFADNPHMFLTKLILNKVLSNYTKMSNQSIHEISLECLQHPIVLVPDHT